MSGTTRGRLPRQQSCHGSQVVVHEGGHRRRGRMGTLDFTEWRRSKGRESKTRRRIPFQVRSRDVWRDSFEVLSHNHSYQRGGFVKGVEGCQTSQDSVSWKYSCRRELEVPLLKVVQGGLATVSLDEVRGGVNHRVGDLLTGKRTHEIGSGSQHREGYRWQEMNKRKRYGDNRLRSNDFRG